MIISRMQNGHWFKGDHPEAFWRYSAKSDDPDKALASAKTSYYRKHKVGRAFWPDVEPGMYVVPNELVPRGRGVAMLMGSRFYVGSPCEHHPLNSIRSVGNKACLVCEILSQKTGSNRLVAP